MALQILFWMLLALFLGLFIGWFFWGQRATGYRSEIVSLQETLGRREARIEQLSNDLLDGKKDLNAIQAETAEMDQLRKTVRNEEQQIDQLSEELTINREELQRLERENEELADVRLDLTKRDQQIADLTRQLDRCTADLDLYKNELADACQEICPPEDMPDLPDLVPAAVAADADDLKEISGVGPYLEGKLNAFGIYTFRQVAALSTEVVAALGATFGSFSDRIEREDWIGQARILHAAKYGETL